ncbi:DUF2231 domain-containing protein [Nocardioides coralli]|uniref:DUF2231 domain-containing protein n=1 Tax=Nocardioides coralli TaxID=2872154 RepID=UPI001CA3AE8E|nr:DUF2231 domain-containing protein [Nocardioides coralli]QZY30147.1 hypothetical protein K6T13_05555 [Nocardioides coralli]
MEISGLPLHPLVVHAAVVLAPLGALTALAYAVPGRFRERLRWPMLLTALAATGSVVAAYVTGTDFLERRPELADNAQLLTHRDRARLLLWVTLGFGVLALAAGWWHQRPGVVRPVLAGLLAVSALGLLVLAVLTGDAGARSVWEGVGVDRT